MSVISQPFRARRYFFFALAAALALGACGRRGDLEPPQGAAVQTPAASGELGFHKPNPKITPPKQPFVLDPLLQ